MIDDLVAFGLPRSAFRLSEYYLPAIRNNPRRGLSPAVASRPAVV
jgi:hypothetical protein